MTGMKSFVALLAAAATVVNAVAIPPHHEVHEKRQTLHPRWKKRDRVQSHKLFQMRIGLKQSNLEDGYRHLMEVSDPSSPNFANHWTSEEVIEAFRPSRQTEDEVRNWLIDSGIPAQRITHTENKAWFAFFATAAEAESLLFTEFHEYEDSVTGGVIPSCDEYHVPKHIRQHIDYITPGIKLMAPVESHREKRAAAMAELGIESRSVHLQQHGKAPPPTNTNDLSTCDQLITPACIAALYKIPPGTNKIRGNSLGIFESELQFYAQKDLDSFFTTYRKDIKNGTHPIGANIDGGMQSTKDLFQAQAGGEVALDLQLAYPIVYPQEITLYDVDDFIVQANQLDTYTFGFNTFLDALDGSYCNFSAYGETGNQPGLDQQYPDPAIGGWAGELMCGVYKPTNVISLSYGGQEADIPVSYQKRQCLEYMKLGLQGVSFLYASGDSGVSNYPPAFGGTDGPTGCLGPKGNIFNPTWPGTCPYVTSVGATKVYPGYTVNDPESAVLDPAYPPYSSGGGFSNIYPIPDYQTKALANYFEKHSPPYPYYSALSPDSSEVPDIAAIVGDSDGIYNRIGRGIPDVSANGDNDAVYCGGSASAFGGTSASAPIFSAVITRLNEARLGAGKKPIGFLNPSLYANPGMLNDITNGTNVGCNTTGFAAVPGWDPVTGLGTPNYPKMLAYYLGLP